MKILAGCCSFRLDLHLSLLLLTLLEFVVKPNRIEDLHWFVRSLIGVDAFQRVYSVPQCQQFGKISSQARKEPFDVIDHLIEAKICNSDVSEVPTVLLAIPLQLHQLWLYLLFPIEFRGLLGRPWNLAIIPIHLADHTDDVVLYVVLALEHVQPDPIAHAVSQEGKLSGLSYDVLDDAVLAGDHEISIL